MHLSTRGRYAIMAMIDLAELSKTSPRPVTLAQIADRQQISLSYLEQLFAKLRKNGVVASVRGPGGGYQIPKPLNLVMLSDIIGAVDEVVDVTRCGVPEPMASAGHAAGCVHGRKCNAHDLWQALSGHIAEFMRRVSLEMVMNGEVTAGFSILGTPDLEDVADLRIRFNA